MITIQKTGFFLLLLFTTITFSQTKIVIKTSGTIITEEITSVKFYGLNLANGESVSYKVIKEISTTNLEIVDSIKNYTSNYKETISKNVVTLDMSKIIYTKPKVEKLKFFNDYLLGLRIMTNKAENFNFSFNFSPYKAEVIVIRIGYSTGVAHDKSYYSLTSVYLGFGIRWHLESVDMIFGFNYGIKGLSRSENLFGRNSILKKTSNEVADLDLSCRIRFSNSPIKVLFGLKYYVENIPINGEETEFSGNFGLGYSF